MPLAVFTPPTTDLDSPASEHSGYTSPLSPSLLFPSQSSEGETSTSSRSARGTPRRTPSNLPRTQSAGKGGCWTCRLRRKKCDEQREGDSCQSCLRLKIQCLGWGAKRPDWMRDKQAQEAYKAQIKAQLLRTGMIRGQPRHRRSPQDGSAPFGGAHDLPGVAGPGPSSVSARSDPGAPAGPGAGAGAFDYFYSYPQPGAYPDQTLVSSPYDQRSPLMPGPFTDASAPLDLRAASTAPPVASSSAAAMPLSSDDDLLQFAMPPDVGLHLGFDPPPQSYAPAPAPGQDAIISEHVRYYLDHVCGLLYPFAADHLSDTIGDLVAHEPQGPAALAVCAVASLHYAWLNTPRGAAPDVRGARAFYDQAFFQLAASAHLHTQYAAADAVAAVHLVHYALLAGATDWLPMLEVACAWLAQQPLVRDEALLARDEGQAARLGMLGMTPAGRFAAKATMWLDIQCGITLAQPPKFLAVYRRLFGSSPRPSSSAGASSTPSFWPTPGTPTSTSDVPFELTLQSLLGAPDDALLALAETAALAYWAAQERRAARLSTRELVRRGDAIERMILRTRARAGAGTPAGGAPAGASAGGGSAPGSAHPSPAPTAQGMPPGSGPAAEARRGAADVFREAAALYLHTVLSGPNPGVPEIGEAVHALGAALQTVPAGVTDRALLFALVSAGCATDDARTRALCKARALSGCGGAGGAAPAPGAALPMGSVLQALALMEAVWARRDAQGGALEVGWRDVMLERRMSLLLV